MMRNYEMIYIARPAVADKELDALDERLESIAKQHQGKVEARQPLGKKPLAFAMGKEKEGTYRQLRFSCEGAAIREMEQILKYNEKILRFMTTRLNGVEEKTK